MRRDIFSRKIGRALMYFMVFSFVFNFVWEIAQAWLYKPHFDGFWGLIIVHLRASAGDVVIFLAIYLMVSFLVTDILWVKRMTIKTILLSSLAGFFLAVFIERYALVTERWGYNDLMPIIPYFEVGLAPILQMILLVPIVSYVSSRAYLATDEES